MATSKPGALLCPVCKESGKLYEFGGATYIATMALFVDPALDERGQPELVEIGTWGAEPSIGCETCKGGPFAREALFRT
jgi:hypothetical protein